MATPPLREKRTHSPAARARALRRRWYKANLKESGAKTVVASVPQGFLKNAKVCNINRVGARSHCHYYDKSAREPGALKEQMFREIEVSCQL